MVSSLWGYEPPRSSEKGVGLDGLIGLLFSAILKSRVFVELWRRAA